MKILNTVQDLWSCCLFCPICQDITRTPVVSVGPDEAVKIKSFKKDNHILHLHCTLELGNRKFLVDYFINCLDNSFEFDISDPELSEHSVDRASSAYFYFYINSDCRECNCSYANSTDLELDFLNSEITNVGLEREGVWLLKEKTKFAVVNSYTDQQTMIYKCNVNDEGMVEDDNRPFLLPIIEFDYSRPRKVVNKIKTLLIFS